MKHKITLELSEDEFKELRRLAGAIGVSVPKLVMMQVLDMLCDPDDNCTDPGDDWLPCQEARK